MRPILPTVCASVFLLATNRQDFFAVTAQATAACPRPGGCGTAETHLDNEEESRAYIDQLWAEAMTIYNSGDYKLAFSPAMQETLQAHQQDFIQEDAQAGMIYAFLEDYTGDRVCFQAALWRHWQHQHPGRWGDPRYLRDHEHRHFGAAISKAGRLTTAKRCTRSTAFRKAGSA